MESKFLDGHISCKSAGGNVQEERPSLSLGLGVVSKQINYFCEKYWDNTKSQFFRPCVGLTLVFTWCIWIQLKGGRSTCKELLESLSSASINGHLNTGMLGKSFVFFLGCFLKKQSYSRSFTTRKSFVVLLYGSFYHALVIGIARAKMVKWISSRSRIKPLLYHLRNCLLYRTLSGPVHHRESFYLSVAVLSFNNPGLLV